MIIRKIVLNTVAVGGICLFSSILFAGMTGFAAVKCTAVAKDWIKELT